MAVLSDEVGQFAFKRIDVRTQGHDPVRVERLPDKILLASAHLGQREVDSVTHDISDLRYMAVYPPSTVRFEPVTHRAASLSR